MTVTNRQLQNIRNTFAGEADKPGFLPRRFCRNHFRCSVLQLGPTGGFDLAKTGK